jgi:hypothetical protein
MIGKALKWMRAGFTGPITRRFVTLAVMMAVAVAGTGFVTTPAHAIPPGCAGVLKLKNTKYEFNQESYPGGDAWEVDGWGPATLTLTKSVTVQNTFNANVSISKSIVTAGVGFSVSWSSTTGTSYAVPVPANQYWKVYAGYVDRVYSFDIWRYCPDGSNAKVGSGFAYKYDHLTYGNARLK